ncbi:leishmanolysin [Gammaproteobacteria bacterium]|nr:leishmanolysin [Gammaproteobacteria bacterium]
MHDIGHVLGITSLLYSAKCQEDSGVTYYTGENALREYKQYYNNSENTDDSNNLIGIPLSSNNKHLEKTEHGYTNNIFHPALANELMTDIGEAQEEENLALSKITIGCLEDLGYAVDYDKADDYNLLPFTQENNIFKWSFNNNIAKNKYKQITYKCMNRWQAVLAERLPDNSLYKIEIEIRDHQYEAGSTTQGAAGITKVQLNNGRTFSREGFVALNKEKTVNFLEVVLLHEIGHILGFGPVIGFHSDRIQQNGNHLFYTGENGLQAYREYYQESDNTGSADDLIGIPLENTGGSGTASAHFEENENPYANGIRHPCMNDELMTGVAEDGCTPLSKITIGVLQDIGYDVDYTQADCYTLPTANEDIISDDEDKKVKRCGCSHD